jgi:hypothetical protein
MLHRRLGVQDKTLSGESRSLEGTLKQHRERRHSSMKVAQSGE